MQNTYSTNSTAQDISANNHTAMPNTAQGNDTQHSQTRHDILQITHQKKNISTAKKKLHHSTHKNKMIQHSKVNTTQRRKTITQNVTARQKIVKALDYTKSASRHKHSTAYHSSEQHHTAKPNRTSLQQDIPRCTISQYTTFCKTQQSTAT